MMRLRFGALLGTGIYLLAAIPASPIVAETGAKAETPPALDALTARAAGVRYGQAAGVALVCYGLKVTPASDVLKARYSGSDLDAFNEEAEKVLASWREMDRCTKSTGPNECRLAHEWSCRDALREIGPTGTVLPGLVEVK